MTKYNHSEFFIEGIKADAISDEERRLIDEAIADGKVHKIPMGASAFAEEYVWQGDEKTSYIGNLVPKSPMTRAEALAKFKARHNGWSKPPNPETTRRRDETLRLTMEGRKKEEIAEIVGVSLGTVKGYQQQLIESGRLPKRSSNGMTRQQVDQRREEVLALIDKGLGKKEICARMGISDSQYGGDRAYLASKGLVKRRTVVNGNEVWV